MQPGDNVIHKSGGKGMLVSEVNGNYITCEWQENGQFKTRVFKKALLEKFTPRKPLTPEEQLALIKYMV